MDFVIKPMESEEEIKGKAYVHWKSWQEAYAGLIDQEYLDHKQTLEQCERIAFQWRENLLVAKDGSRVIGFAGYGAYRDNTLPQTGEVYAVYVLKEYYGRGVGQALMSAALEKLAEYPKIALWVLEGNERAIRFYEKYGYKKDGAKQEITLGSPVSEIRLIYTR